MRNALPWSQQTYCGQTEACSATPTTTTSTITSTGTYAVETNTFMYASEPVEASSFLASLSSSIVSRRNAMDATRWASVTVTASGSSTDSSSTNTKSKTTSTTTSTTTKKTTSTTTTVSIPTATEFCVKYVIENEDTSLDKYGSKYDEFIFVMWGITWSGLGPAIVESEIEDDLEDCGITADIHVAVDTAEWGTVAMWNNGETDVVTSCVKTRSEALGGGTPDCQWILKTSEADDYTAKDSADISHSNSKT
ncbi:glycoside hydrolase [Penicillium malachiteum]|uniref:Glycoside hydrolase n=1 Tax=Penicillium malachiteum TaxID=1324776 RepID=A0AAD6MW40_9EURO|nr:glycoside hydrolase [Penicillium malachiteum]